MKISAGIFFLLALSFVKPSAWGASERLELGMSLDQYLNVSEPGVNNDQLVRAQINRFRKFIFGTYTLIDADLIYSNKEESLYYNLKNLNLNYGRRQRLIVGTHRQSFNEGLEFWSSSEWNPQVQRNRLQVKEGGLTGVFYKQKGPSWQMTLMYSPYFLPHQGPNYKFANGDVTSQNPWFLSPPDSVPYQGESFQTNYSFDKPDLTQFLNAQTYLASFQTSLSKKFRMRFNWANKPSPHILTDLNFTADASKPNVPIDVFIKPRVIRHHLRSLEGTWNLDSKNTFRMSYLQERFENPDFDTQSFTYQMPEDQDVVSLIWEQKMYRYDLNLGLIHREGGAVGSAGELSSALMNQGIKNIYERAFKISLRLKKLWKWDVRGDIAYDWRQEGFLGSLYFKRLINPQAFFELGIDAIEPLSSSPESSFVYQYRNLDRVWAGVGYVF